MARKNDNQTPVTKNQQSEVRPPEISAFRHPLSAVALATWVVVWAVMVEVSNEAWFRSHEARGGGTIAWAAQWPVDNPTLRTNVITENAQQLLKCDQNTTASWTGEDDVFWQVFYLRWLPADSFYDRAKVAMSKTHNPTICLQAEGMKLETDLDPVSLEVRPGFNLMFDRYVFVAGGRDLYVFFSQTEDMKGGGPASLRMTHLARLRAALAGSRNYGQINFEAALAGPETPAAALRIFSTRLPELIKTGPSGP
jgi:hypothetical protein